MNELLEEYGYNYKILYYPDGDSWIEFYGLDGTSFAYVRGPAHE